MRKVFIVAGSIMVVAVAAAVITLIAGNQTDDSAKRSDGKKMSYVALGDSVAAGIGLLNYSDASACNRTEQAYPNRIANDLKMNVTNLACSGATIAAGVNGPQTVNGLVVPSQLDRLFERADAPDVISLTIGANDIGWTQFAACYSTDCSVAEQKIYLTQKLALLRQDVSSVMTKIKQQYVNDMPQVIVSGYYGLLAANGSKSCPETTGLDPDEIGLVNDVVTGLDDSMRSAIKPYNFAVFAAVDFAGHELCSDAPWIQGLDDKAPFHPTEAGQSAIAKQLTPAIRLK